MTLCLEYSHIPLRRERVEGTTKVEPRRRERAEAEPLERGPERHCRHHHKLALEHRHDGRIALGRQHHPICAQRRTLGHAKPTTQRRHEEDVESFLERGGGVLGEGTRRLILQARRLEHDKFVGLRRNLQLARPLRSSKVARGSRQLELLGRLLQKRSNRSGNRAAKSPWGETSERREHHLMLGGVGRGRRRGNRTRRRLLRSCSDSGRWRFPLWRSRLGRRKSEN